MSHICFTAVVKRWKLIQMCSKTRQSRLLCNKQPWTRWWHPKTQTGRAANQHSGNQSWWKLTLELRKKQWTLICYLTCAKSFKCLASSFKKILDIRTSCSVLLVQATKWRSGNSRGAVDLICLKHLKLNVKFQVGKWAQVIQVGWCEDHLTAVKMKWGFVEVWQQVYYLNRAKFVVAPTQLQVKVKDQAFITHNVSVIMNLNQPGVVISSRHFKRDVT